MAKRRYEIDMTSGPLAGKILSFAMPLMLTGILQLLYNAADMIVVGNFGSKTSLAAVGSTGALINLIVNVFMGLSVGASVVVAKAIGSGDTEKASRATHTAVFISLISGVGVGVFGVLMARTLLTWMGSPDDVIELSTLYVKIYFAGLPATMLYNFGAAILRAMGDTKRPLYFLSLSGIINVGLNLLLVIVFKLDVAGVAIATVASTTVSAVLVTVCLAKTDGCCKLYFRKLKISKNELWEIAKVGLPAGIQGSIFSISNVLIQSSVNSFGSMTMSGNAAAANLEGFVWTAMNSIYQAALTFTGQNMGAGKYKRVRAVCAWCLIIVCAIGILSGMFVFLFRNTLIGIYDSDPDIIAEGAKRTAVIAVTYAICGAMDVMVGMMRGMGKSIVPMIVSIFGVCGIRIIWIYTVFAQFHSLFWLYYSYPISWVVTLFVHILCFEIMKRKLPKEDIPTKENARSAQ
ncbi:MAG: MATE family efflux transporter [Clostridia bacterium]|nr:MATE family efflux transporter [Clostridia bacterium]